MKCLITGVSGQLGFDIKRELLSQNINVENILALTHEEMDITNREMVRAVVLNYKPDVIFHCAAYTAVDKAEENQELVELVNVVGTKNLVDASIEIGAKIIYVSTDYVFDGKKEDIYRVEDIVNPLNIYGKTKYLGEEEVKRNPKHFITRISWVFGENGNNFVKTMLKLADKYQELNVVDDQVGSPTYTIDLAKLLVNMAEKDSYGIYHITNEGFCTWAEFAEYIFKINAKKVKVNKVTTEEYLKITGAKQAVRPRNSKLDKSKLEENGFTRLPEWQDATERFCLSLKKEENK